MESVTFGHLKCNVCQGANESIDKKENTYRKMISGVFSSILGFSKKNPEGCYCDSQLVPFSFFNSSHSSAIKRIARANAENIERVWNQIYLNSQRQVNQFDPCKNWGDDNDLNRTLYNFNSLGFVKGEVVQHLGLEHRP